MIFMIVYSIVFLTAVVWARWYTRPLTYRRLCKLPDNYFLELERRSPFYFKKIMQLLHTTARYRARQLAVKQQLKRLKKLNKQ